MQCSRGIRKCKRKSLTGNQQRRFHKGGHFFVETWKWVRLWRAQKLRAERKSRYFKARLYIKIFHNDENVLYPYYPILVAIGYLKMCIVWPRNCMFHFINLIKFKSHLNHQQLAILLDSIALDKRNSMFKSPES